MKPFFSARSLFRVILYRSLDFRLAWYRRVVSLLWALLTVNPPLSPNCSKSFTKASLPSLNTATAKCAASDTTGLDTKTSFGQYFQITLLIDSLLFWVWPCRHLQRRSLSASLLKMSSITSTTASGSPCLCLYVLGSRLYLHHVLGPSGQKLWFSFAQ